MKYLVVILLLILASCSTVYEKHYFKEQDNYYRLRIKATSFASKSRYISGYYSEYALNNYFGDLSKNDTIRLVNLYNNQNQSDGNNKLVMIMSTNSNAITGQINAAAESDEMLSLVARMGNKDKLEMVQQHKFMLENIEMRNQSAQQAGNIYLKENFSDQQLLEYLNFLIRLQEQNIVLSDTTAVKNWIQSRKTR